VHHPGYEFVASDYAIRVFARQTGRADAMLLSEVRLTVEAGHAEALAERRGIMFELEQDTQTYLGHSRERPPHEHSTA